MKLMVIDGNSIVNRSFYGVRPLTTRDGLYTNAVYGFVTTLLRLLEEENPEALCVTFDRPEPTFRHLAYEGYKAQRRGMPEELAQQMPVLKEVLDAMDIPRYELAGFEAEKMRGGGLGVRGGHRGQGQPPAHHGAHQGQAGLHPHGPDHHQGHDAGNLPGGVRL